MKINKMLFFLVLAIQFSSCKKFLTTTNEGQLIPKSAADYDLLLNSEQLINSGNGLLDVMTDDAYNPLFRSSGTPSSALAYIWADQLDERADNPPVIWSDHYAHIYIFNIIINKVDQAETGTTTKKRSLKAEALLGRAFELLSLVNIYGKPYDKASAATNPAVPFIVSNDITVKTPPRASVDFIYEQIIHDIKAAIPDLPADNSINKFRGSISAANSILARTYLYMGNYEEAAKYAELAINGGTTELLDYNVTGIPLSLISKQEIYVRFDNVSGVGADPGLLESYDQNDFRLNLYYYLDTLNNARQGVPNLVPERNNYGTSVAEMKLIIAEAAARANHISLALQQLNELRKFRISRAAYQPVQLAGQEEVLQSILQERRRELAFKGLRWFDMRRFDLEGRMKAITRLDDHNMEAGVLAVHSSKYTLKIPANVLSFNPDMSQN
ncbi:hypothetical protein TH53_00485 [Pedobacter lusitanus]|uniref:SusD family protein n=1 Tax=Pedobacter lusitanus TaxID=1503925 RepID=A0A0D0GRW2_9SPHI|nr:RagB/SusD family nutrient uptake outer membrane protein [Pedobacter lusitanus]KIO78995.1 hypothetical protein TH53_00485 [Pedobacter lusitanus]